MVIHQNICIPTVTSSTERVMMLLNIIFLLFNIGEELQKKGNVNNWLIKIQKYFEKKNKSIFVLFKYIKLGEWTLNCNYELQIEPLLFQSNTNTTANQLTVQRSTGGGLNYWYHISPSILKILYIIQELFNEVIVYDDICLSQIREIIDELNNKKLEFLVGEIGNDLAVAVVCRRIMEETYCLWKIVNKTIQSIQEKNTAILVIPGDSDNQLEKEEKTK